MNMNNEIFGELIFNTGWKTKAKITLFNKEYEVVVKAKAYRETDGITAEQEKAYFDFGKNKSALLMTSEKLLNDHAEGKASGRFVPRTLLFNRDGNYALLLDDKDDKDGGVAVTLTPKAEVLSQDEYL
jgi:hypothetical protein